MCTRNEREPRTFLQRYQVKLHFENGVSVCGPGPVTISPLGYLRIAMQFYPILQRVSSFQQYEIHCIR